MSDYVENSFFLEMENGPAFSSRPVFGELAPRTKIFYGTVMETVTGTGSMVLLMLKVWV
jgi:hypothetical protein